VSLTSVCCKIMESVVRDTVTKHLTMNKLIGQSQHGFVKGRSCATTLLEFLEQATAAVDRGEAFDIIYLDFAKAFDKVPHRRLIKKMRAHGISGQLLRWVESWLANRKQRVVLNGKFSSWAKVLSGVPQGSVLGPLLFVIFISDIDEAVTQVDIIKKFADDTKIGQTIATEQNRRNMQQALDNLSTWASRWGMEFYVPKCKVMHLGHNNPHNEYLMDGQRLETTEEEKDIGVTVTGTLKTSAQCASASKTAQSVLSQISRAFHYRDRHVFMRLYQQYSMFAHT
jgi:ribonuclease P/MRP protein subunit RPP40